MISFSVISTVVMLTMMVFDDVSAAPSLDMVKRHVLDCSDSVKGPIISQAYTDAKTLASVASQYITTNGATDSLYIDYFKTNDPAVVKGFFDAIANDNSNQFLRCPASCSAGVNAYTQQPSGNIYFCGPFFNLADQSALCTSSGLPATKSGTMVHELGHAINHRSDVSGAGSCSGARSLSAANQLASTTNYSCFSRQVFKNTQC